MIVYLLCIVCIIFFGIGEVRALDIYVPLCLNCLSQNQSLVEFTVISSTYDETAHEQLGSPLNYRLVINIDNIVIKAQNEWPLLNEEIITSLPYPDSLEVGHRYLTFINPIMLDGRVLARINEDMTITPIWEYGGYIQNYKGYTVSEFKDFILEMQLNDIHESYSNDLCFALELSGVQLDLSSALINSDDLINNVNISIHDYDVSNNSIGDGFIIISTDMLIGIIITATFINAFIILIIYFCIKRRYINKNRTETT